jgi:hypothetical protein
LPAQLERWDLRGQVEGVWRKGFAVLSLNEDNPPVWMRVTPQGLDYGGYTIVGNRLVLRLGLVALTQAVVGHRPEDPAPTPLPALGPVKVASSDAVRIFAPVLADYAQLVPVIGRALDKRSARPFDIPGVGPVTAHFANVEVYGATKGASRWAPMWWRRRPRPPCRRCAGASGSPRGPIMPTAARSSISAT